MQKVRNRIRHPGVDQGAGSRALPALPRLRQRRDFAAYYSSRARAYQQGQRLRFVLRGKSKAGMLRMSDPVRVVIIGTPVACPEGVKDSWREVAVWLAGKLRQRYGGAVEVQYIDLFDRDCPSLPTNAQLPLVMIDGEVISMGKKISMPDIRAHLEQKRLMPGTR